MTSILFGRKWFNYLVPDNNNRICLFPNGNVECKIGGIIVCYVTIYNTHIFHRYDDYLDFYMDMISLPEHTRTFFEIIPKGSQKPHFDIDIASQDPNINSMAENIKDMIIAKILEVYTHISLERDICLYTSHGYNNEKCPKRSYHIVITNYYHMDNYDAQELYRRVTMDLDPQYKEYIDGSVYKSNQQFRIVGNQKRDSHRPKDFQKSFKFKDTLITHQYLETSRDIQHEQIIILEESLITNIHGGNCLILLERPIVKVLYKKEDFDISDMDAENAMELLNRYEDFKCAGIKNNIVILRHLRSYNCPVCVRIHENENPYLRITLQGIFFVCRRSLQSINIGHINLDIKAIKVQLEDIRQSSKINQ